MVTVQELRLRFYNLQRDLKHHWNRFREKSTGSEEQRHVMSQDEMVDEASRESFPASDPPGHFSKSATDKELHTP